MTDALATLRVLDLSVGIAGAYCTKLFVDAGADVVKVEPPGGDPLRRYTAAGLDLGARALADEAGVLFRFLNAGKRSLVGEPGDADVRELVAGSDLVVDSGRLSSDAIAALRAAHPQLVVLTVTPFGRTGPLAGRAATEFTVQAESGTLAYRGRHARPPVQIGGRGSEFIAGVYAAAPALAAVMRARRTGVGEDIDASMIEAMAIAGSTFADMAHHMARRPELTTPARSFETPSSEQASDGLVGFNTNTGQMFEGFAILIERPELAGTEWSSLATRIARVDEWQKMIDEYMPDHPVAEIVERAAALRVPVSPVNSAATLPTNEHVVARGLLLRDDDGVLRPRPPYRLDDDEVPRPRRAPRLGEHEGDVEPSVLPRPTDPGADPGALPLAGLKVLDLTSWWAGTSGTHVLALLGAEVIHVESITHPDGMRLTGAMFGGERWWENGHMFAVANTDKLGITLDIAHQQGRDLLVRLIEWADVFVENFAPRVVENWGLDRHAVLAVNPRIVYMRMPGFGLDGPWRERGAFAQTQEQMTGLAWITGYPDDLPIIPRGIADPNAGMHGAFAVLVALAQRDRTGAGVFVEAPMVEAALNIAAQPVMEHSAYGFLMERMGNRSPCIAPQGLYACRGFERWLALSVATDEQWRALRDALDDPEWGRDPALDTVEGRVAHHDALDAALRDWAVDRELDDVVARLVAHGVPAAPVFDPRVLSRHPQLVARRFFEEVDHPVLGRHPAPGLPYRFASVDHWLHRATPTLGQDNHDVLSRILGLSGEAIAELEEAAVIGDRPTGL